MGRFMKFVAAAVPIVVIGLIASAGMPELRRYLRIRKM